MDVVYMHTETYTCPSMEDFWQRLERRYIHKLCGKVLKLFGMSLSIQKHFWEYEAVSININCNVQLGKFILAIKANTQMLIITLHTFEKTVTFDNYLITETFSIQVP